jgi:hypothetical protein
MTTRFLPLMLLALLTTACEIGGRSPGVVVPGPTVPSPFPTTPPYVWDTAEELSIWMNNPVARGSLTLEGSGTDAFIRIDRADREWVLRGPDLEPAAEGVRTLSIRYRWRPDPSLPPTASLTAWVNAYFQMTTPAVNQDPLVLQGQFKPPIGVEYCYVHSFGANRGVLEIDRIELVR